ncbi:MAG: zinc ABC transporter ATP-binding protein ZnuC [Gammaproteobacteria bacterium]
MTETAQHRSPGDSGTLIAAHALSVNFRERTILDRVDLTVSRGEIVTVIGLNGAGKSTLVRALLGLIRPASGRIHRQPGLRIGYSPQHLHLDATLPLSVARFLTLGGRAPRPRLRELLAEVGVAGVLDSQVADISGGELHRVLLARALLRKPDLLVLDEPLAGVDVAGQSELYRLIADIRDRYACGVLMVSHDLHVVMAATDKVVCINHHVCCTGRPESVTRHPEFVALFGPHVAEGLAVYSHHHDHQHDVAGAPVPLDES